LIGLVGPQLPWLWLILLTLPIFGWFIEQDQRDVQRLIALSLDELARGRKFLKITRNEKTNKPQVDSNNPR
jgi:hypothetical protein